MGDILGVTGGDIGTAFGFSVGTDLTPWTTGNMFTSSSSGWLSSGTTQFTTSYVAGSTKTPGLGVGNEDLVGSTWTPDISWSKSGTFASIGMTPGIYTITDADTSEFISIQILTATLPEPSSLDLFGVGPFFAGAVRRRKKLAATA